MSVHRVMGIETEYGISTPQEPRLSPVMSSTHVVSAYAHHALQSARSRARWDYEVESPLRDARGFDMTRAEADPSQLTDEDLGAANAILPNGARLYVDHAHPEYSSPEVTNPRDAVLWDRAGMVVMQRAMALADAQSDIGAVVLYKNNTDNKGASYGCHENYLMERSVPFADIVHHLVPFFVTRQAFAGAGRLGIGQEGRVSRFQLSQRADFFEAEVGLETTLKRPIINTRDEPHADPEKFRRLHVIVGDANMSEFATYLKMGTTAIVLSMIEQGALDRLDLWPAHPVAQMHRVSHDTQFAHLIELADGRRMSALDVQEAFLERAQVHCRERGELDESTADVLGHWQRVLDTLRVDPRSLAHELDWLAKLDLMDGYRRRDGLGWDSPRLQLIDLQYADIRPDKGLALRLEARDRLVRLLDDDEVLRAVGEPPVDTRAFFRGQCMSRYPDSVAAASWDCVVLDIPGREALVRIPTIDPLRGTQAHVGQILDRCPDAQSLVQALTAATR